MTGVQTCALPISTEPDLVKTSLVSLRATNPHYALTGSYGDHLKAVVEAFVAAARKMLLGPTYVIVNGKSRREVPRMAFRLEIIDEFRIDGLAREIYRDLILGSGVKTRCQG